MADKRFQLMSLDDLADRISLISYGQPGHVVDQLIAERSQKIVKNPLWPVARPFLHVLLHYRQAIKFADDIANLPGHEAMEYASRLLNLELKVHNGERIPESGGFMMVSNHPTGIADGVAVFDLLKHRRPDMMIFANRDALRVNPRFVDLVIPVEWREEYKSKLKARETLQLTTRSVKEGKATVLFPSGRIAYWADGRLNERPWKVSAVGLARKYKLPVSARAHGGAQFPRPVLLAVQMVDGTARHDRVSRGSEQEEQDLRIQYRPADRPRRTRGRSERGHESAGTPRGYRSGAGSGSPIPTAGDGILESRRPVFTPAKEIHRKV